MPHASSALHAQRLGRHRLVAWLAACLASLTLTLPALSAPAADAGLPGLLAIAQRANPDLEAARLRYQASRSKEGVAGALEPPRLNLTLMNVWGFEGPSAAVSQMLPLGQKRELETRMASREAAMAEAEIATRWLAIASDVKQAYYELVYLEKALAIHHATREQVKNLQRVANARYAVGSAAQQDSLRAQVELSKLYDSEFDITQRSQSARHRLNSLLNRPMDTAIELPRDFPKEPAVPATSRMLAAAEAHNPMIKAAESALAAQEARQALASEERSAPDLEVGLQVGQTMPTGTMAGATYLGGMLEVTLPWLTPGRNQGRVDEATYAAAAAKANVAAQRTTLGYRVRDLANQLHRTNHRLELYRKGLFSQVNQSLRAALVAYQVNKSDFSTVIDAQMAVFDTQMGHALAQSEYFRLMAMLESELNLPDPASTPREK